MATGKVFKGKLHVRFDCGSGISETQKNRGIIDKLRDSLCVCGGVGLVMIFTSFAIPARGESTGWWVNDWMGHWNDLVFGTAEEEPPYCGESCYFWEYGQETPWYAKKTVWISWAVEYIINGMRDTTFSWDKIPPGFDFDVSMEWNTLHVEGFDISGKSRAVNMKPYGGSKNVILGGYLPKDKGTIRVGYTFSREEMSPGDDYVVSMHLTPKSPLAEGVQQDLDKSMTVRFVVPELDLDVKEAKPAEGKLALKWEISDASKAYYQDMGWDMNADKMHLKIWRSSSKYEDKWDDFFKSEPVKGGEDVRYSDGSFIDETYGEAKGCRPVMYWVEIKGGLQIDGRPATEPNRLKTRNRHCLAFGLSRYDQDTTKWNNNKPPAGHVHDAEEAKAFYRRIRATHLDVNEMSFSSYAHLNDSCTIENVEEQISITARSPRLLPGDEVFIFIATHGNPTDLALYDGAWSKDKFADAIRLFKNKGVKVVGVLNACHSGAIADVFDTDEFRYTAWVAAARNGEVAACYDNMSGFGKVFMDWGWNEGYAKLSTVYSRDNKNESTGATSSEYVNLLEVATYANLLFPGRSTRVTPNGSFTDSYEQHFHCVNRKMLANTDLKHIGAAPSSARPVPPRAESNITPNDNINGICVYQNRGEIFKYEYRKKYNFLSDMTWGVVAVTDDRNIATPKFYTEYQYDKVKFASAKKGSFGHYAFHFVEADNSYDVYVRALGPAGWSERGDRIDVTIPSDNEWYYDMCVSGKMAALVQTVMDGFGEEPQQIVVETEANGTSDSFTMRVRIGDDATKGKYRGWYRRSIENVKLDSRTGEFMIEFDDTERYVYTETNEERIGGRMTLKFSPEGISGTWAGKEFTGHLYLLRDDEDDDDEHVPFVTEQTEGAVAEVAFDGNGGRASEYWRTVVIGEAVGKLPTATISDSSLVFDGWWTEKVGGMRITASTIVTAPTTYYAHWRSRGNDTDPISGLDPEPGQTPEPSGMRLHELISDISEGSLPISGATVYDGCLYDGDRNVKGTIQVKVGKPNAKTHLASVKATVIGLDGKKKSLKAVEKGKALIQANSPTTVQLVGGDVCEVTLGSKGMVGEYGNYFIDGALNVFTSKDATDKATAAAVLGKWQGVVNVAWQNAGAARSVIAPYQTLSVTIANKGKAKVAGTLADGTKVSASSQLLVGDEWYCVPVLEPKKSHLAFVLWLPKNGGSAVVTGLADAIVGKPGTLKSGAEFRMDEVLGEAKYAKYLPEGLGVTVNGAKWVLPKAGKVQLAKDGSGSVDETQTGDNPSALKLTYTAKTGTFKGTFKAYSDVRGKPKGVTVNVTGVLVDGVGYGAATIKKVGGVSVTIK